MTDAEKIALLRQALQGMIDYAETSCGMTDDPDFTEFQAALRAMEAT
jgi:hypothetical protein